MVPALQPRLEARGPANPPNPDGLRSDYLWREVLTRASLSRILENYAQVVASRNAKTGKKKASPDLAEIPATRTWCADSCRTPIHTGQGNGT